LDVFKAILRAQHCETYESPPKILAGDKVFL